MDEQKGTGKTDDQEAVGGNNDVNNETYKRSREAWKRFLHREINSEELERIVSGDVRGDLYKG